MLVAAALLFLLSLGHVSSMIPRFVLEPDHDDNLAKAVDTFFSVGKEQPRPEFDESTAHSENQEIIQLLRNAYAAEQLSRNVAFEYNGELPRDQHEAAPWLLDTLLRRNGERVSVSTKPTAQQEPRSIHVVHDINDEENLALIEKHLPGALNKTGQLKLDSVPIIEKELIDDVVKLINSRDEYKRLLGNPSRDDTTKKVREMIREDIQEVLVQQIYYKLLDSRANYMEKFQEFVDQGHREKLIVFFKHLLEAYKSGHLTTKDLNLLKKLISTIAYFNDWKDHDFIELYHSIQTVFGNSNGSRTHVTPLPSPRPFDYHLFDHQELTAEPTNASEPSTTNASVKPTYMRKQLSSKATTTTSKTTDFTGPTTTRRVPKTKATRSATKGPSTRKTKEPATGATTGAQRKTTVEPTSVNPDASSIKYISTRKTTSTKGPVGGSTTPAHPKTPRKVTVESTNVNPDASSVKYISIAPTAKTTGRPTRRPTTEPNPSDPTYPSPTSKKHIRTSTAGTPSATVTSKTNSTSVTPTPSASLAPASTIKTSSKPVTIATLSSNTRNLPGKDLKTVLTTTKAPTTTAVYTTKFDDGQERTTTSPQRIFPSMNF